MAVKGVWSLQPFLDDQPSAFAENPPNRIKQIDMFSGTDNAYTLAKKYKIKTVVIYSEVDEVTEYENIRAVLGFISCINVEGTVLSARVSTLPKTAK